MVNQGRLGLGVITRARWRDANAKGRRSLVQEELRRVEEEDRQARAAAMTNQGRWTCLGGVQGRPLGWRDMWGMEEKRIKFLLCSTYDVLPTPVNLHHWGLAESPDCMLCRKLASLEHVLSSCQASLADGKFRWRHDQILAELATGLEEERRKTHNSTRTTAPRLIRFVRAGESSSGTSTGAGILTLATDWDMRVDLRSSSFQRKSLPQLSDKT